MAEGPSWAVAHVVAEELESRASDPAVSRLSSTTRTRTAESGPDAGGRRGVRRGMRLGLRRGKPHDELAALAGPVALRHHGPAVQLDEALDEGQADAQTALRAGERAVALGEQVEDLGELLGGDARPRCRAPG